MHHTFGIAGGPGSKYEGRIIKHDRCQRRYPISIRTKSESMISDGHARSVTLCQKHYLADENAATLARSADVNATSRQMAQGLHNISRPAKNSGEAAQIRQLAPRRHAMPAIAHAQFYRIRNTRFGH
jgi:hypothetical protein